MPLKIPGRAYFGKMIVTLSIEHSFFMLALLVEYIFLATFYGLYFNHQFFLHITLYESETIHGSSMYQSADWIEQIDYTQPPFKFK